MQKEKTSTVCQGQFSKPRSPRKRHLSAFFRSRRTVKKQETKRESFPFRRLQRNSAPGDSAPNIGADSWSFGSLACSFRSALNTPFPQAAGSLPPVMANFFTNFFSPGREFNCPEEYLRGERNAFSLYNAPDMKSPNYSRIVKNCIF